MPDNQPVELDAILVGSGHASPFQRNLTCPHKGLPLCHFSAKPETFLSLKMFQAPNESRIKCLRQTEKWTSVSPRCT